jgi:hypothetical protein
MKHNNKSNIMPILPQLTDEKIAKKERVAKELTEISERYLDFICTKVMDCRTGAVISELVESMGYGEKLWEKFSEFWKSRISIFKQTIQELRENTTLITDNEAFKACGQRCVLKEQDEKLNWENFFYLLRQWLKRNKSPEAELYVIESILSSCEETLLGEDGVSLFNATISDIKWSDEKGKKSYDSGFSYELIAKLTEAIRKRHSEMIEAIPKCVLSALSTQSTAEVLSSGQTALKAADEVPLTKITHNPTQSTAEVLSPGQTALNAADEVLLEKKTTSNADSAKQDDITPLASEQDTSPYSPLLFGNFSNKTDLVRQPSSNFNGTSDAFGALITGGLGLFAAGMVVGALIECLRRWLRKITTTRAPAPNSDKHGTSGTFKLLPGCQF